MLQIRRNLSDSHNRSSLVSKLAEKKAFRAVYAQRNFRMVVRQHLKCGEARIGNCRNQSNKNRCHETNRYYSKGNERPESGKHM